MAKLRQADVLIVDCWRMDYNHYRPHSSLDYMAPAVFVAEDNEKILSYGVDQK